MSHLKPQVLFLKNVLAFTITSVISGWVLGQANSSNFPTGEWPPTKTKEVTGEEHIPDGVTVTVGPKDAKTAAEIKFIEMKGGKLTIDKGGTVTSESPAPAGSEVFMIRSKDVGGNSVINHGELSSAKDKAGHAAEVIIRLEKSKDTASNYGTMNIQGVKRLGPPRGIELFLNDGSVTNEEGATINASSDEAIGLMVLNGSGTNKGTINLNDKAQAPSYGMKASNYKLHPSSLQGNPILLNDSTGIINVQGENDYGMAAAIFAGGSKPPQDRYSAATNKGIIHVTGKNSVGLSTDTDQGMIDNSLEGTVFTHQGTTGIKISNNGKLINPGTVKGMGTGLLFEGDFPKGILIQQGNVEGSPAIKMVPETATNNPLYLEGLKVKGDIIGSGGKNSILHIAPKSKETPVSIASDISGFPTITVSGTSWSSSGWISGATTLNTASPISQLYVSDKKEALIEPPGAFLRFATTSKSENKLDIKAEKEGKIENLHLYGSAQLNHVSGLEHINVYQSGDWSVDAPLPNLLTITAGLKGEINEISTQAPSSKPKSLSLSFSQLTLVGRNLAVHSLPESIIKKIDLSSKGSSNEYRPPLWLFMQGGSVANITGDPDRYDQIILDSGRVEGEVTGIGEITVTGKEWIFLDWAIGTQKVDLQASINGILVSDVKAQTQEQPIRTLRIKTSSDATRPLSITSSADQQADLWLQGKAQISELQGARDIYLESSDDWSVAGSVKNPHYIKIETTGGVDSISTGTDSTSKQKTLALTFNGSYTSDDFFTVENHGTLKNLNFASAGSRPPLQLIQAAGSVDSIKGRPDLGDKLLLSGGKIVRPVNGIANVVIAGKDWTTAAIQDPASIIIAQGGAASLVTTKAVNEPADAATLPLSFTTPPAEPPSGLKNVTLINHGTVTAIELNDPGDRRRPGINMIQRGGIIGSILSQPGKGDTLDVQGDVQGSSAVKGNISWLDSLTFSGQNTEFGGQRIETMMSTKVTGKLTLTSGQTVLVTPVKIEKDRFAPEKVPYITTFHIEKGGTLSSLKNGTVLEVEGIYRQGGKLEIPLDKQSDPKTHYVKARFVEIGPEAVVLLDNKTAIGEGEYLLMQATDSDINATPTLETTAPPSRYTRLYPRLAARQLFITSTDEGLYVGNLAKSGGANPSAVKAIETAVNRKQSDTLSPLHSGDSDPLNTWVLDELRKEHDNAAKVAKIADQMTPDLSGASISSAIDSIRQAGSAVGARQSGLRTGIATGDMVASDHFWLQYAHSDATQEKKDLYCGYEAKTHGFTLGVDSDLNERLTLGVAYTYSKGDVKGTDGSTSQFDTEGHTFSVYSSFEQGPRKSGEPVGSSSWGMARSKATLTKYWNWVSA